MLRSRVQSSERVHLRERVHLSEWVHPRKGVHMHDGVHLREEVHQRGLIKLERVGQFHIWVTTVGHVVLLSMNVEVTSFAVSCR